LVRITLPVLFFGLALVGRAAAQGAVPESATKVFRFNLVRSPALSTSPNCVPDARGQAAIHEAGPVQILNVKVEGLPPKTDFDFFVIQVPNAKFGMAWYQGDIETNKHGVGSGQFIGRFSIETFVVAPGIAPAPLTFNNEFPSVSMNPKTGPIQMYHLASKRRKFCRLSMIDRRKGASGASFESARTRNSIRRERPQGCG